MERSEDAMRIGRICSENNGFLHKQLENEKSMHEMPTTLLSTYPPKLIATILKALREQLKENVQLHSVEETAGPVPEIPLKCHQIL